MKLPGRTHSSVRFAENAVGFSVAALRLAARDQRVGWSHCHRRAHLDKLECLSRILTGGGCANLASCVLGRVLRRLPVRNAEEAHDLVGRYRQRWRVEDFCRVLKSECRAQDQRFRTAEWLEKAVEIQIVKVLTLLGREAPRCAAVVLLARNWSSCRPTPSSKAGSGRAT